MPLGDLHDLLLPISLGSLGVVDGKVSAVLEADIELGLGRASGDDLGSEGLADLKGSESHSSGSSVDEEVLSCVAERSGRVSEVESIAERE